MIHLLKIIINISSQPKNLCSINCDNKGNYHSTSHQILNNEVIRHGNVINHA